MESYPGELLVGVSPLVFCVDATLASKTALSDPDTTAASGGGGATARSQFDRFLDAMAASLLDVMEPEGGARLFHDVDSKFSPTGTARRRGVDDNGMLGLFRGDGDSLEIDSDHEDDLILGGDTTGIAMTTLYGSNVAVEQPAGSELDPKRTRSFGVAFPRIGAPGGNSRNPMLRFSSKDGNAAAAASSVAAGVSTSFARALQEGQGFFQRARIVSISHRHGFPPSKDPGGDDNRIKDFFIGKTLRTGKIMASTKRRPIDGILPSGWLEKHAAALPSVIIVVVQVTSHQHQHEQNFLLQETMNSLQMSLASKRECKIRVVGLVDEGISTAMAQEWKQTMTETLDGQPPFTLLDVADLQDNAPSIKLQTFHKTVRDASFRYYTTQARRTKHKLSELGPARGTPLLLPLCIRYCFKVAMFYEFQWNPEKSLKYMAEAYRHVETYYRYLLQQREIANHANYGGSATQDMLDAPKIRLSSNNSSATTDNESAGVEMSLPTEVDDVNNLLLNPPNVPFDMVHQCRVLADWLNFKILQFGLTSHTAGGLLTASAQLQKHNQAFCSPFRSFICSPDNAYMDWSFVAHQRMVASQLLERNPPRSLGELGNDNDEVLLRCSPCKAYEATAEALLRLGVEVKKATKSNLVVETVVDDARTRYVGGLDKSGYQPKLQEELKVNHQELALDCLRRAISFYERDLEKHGLPEGDDAPLSLNRSGARSYYLAGGTLLGLERYSEAASFLEKTLKLAKGWKGMETNTRRMLVKCYEKHISVKSPDSCHLMASVLLDSYFKLEMSSEALRRALKNISSMSTGPIKWHHECSDDEDDSLPFSFSLTFPHGTHGTAGDTVATFLHIKSNLDSAVHVNSVTLLTLAGNITLPSSDLLSAKNADRGVEGGTIIQARSTIWISTSIKLPKELDEVGANDEPGNGGGTMGVGKGSFSKSARPRTGGLTAAGGGRFASEDVFGDGKSRSSKSQWSLKCLGGKALRCDGICMSLYPVLSAATEESDSIQLELVMEKKKEVLAETTIKRTAFEEDHYVALAWKRPSDLPLKLGPRCLRVLPPLADMRVTNITEDFTNGKALEGTVNRVLLRLKAGSEENCSDVAIRVSCSSFLVSASGDSTKITTDPVDEEETIAVVDPSNPHVRTPVLVREDKGTSSAITAYGYEIPKGWTLVGEDGHGTIEDTFSPVIETLTSGEQVYAFFDIFRPSPPVTRSAGLVDVGEAEDGLAYQRSNCHSDIDVSIRYRQKRSLQRTAMMTTKCRGRRQPDDEDLTSLHRDGNESDEVFLTQTVSILWSQPISTTFSPGVKSTHPCGNRHPTNILPDSTSTGNLIATTLESEMVLVDGERVTTKCTCEAAADADGLFADIQEVTFEDPTEDNAPCKFTLLSGKDTSGLLYRAHPEDPCRRLFQGSKFSLAWTSEVNMASDYLKGSVSAPLGILSIAWAPCPIKLPDEVKESAYSESITMHGPLLIESPLICRFIGPPCYIENAPFETKIDRLPDFLEVATPFDITYHIKNKTALDQKLNISLTETEHGVNEYPHGFMVAGLATGEISLGPFETHRLSYTAVATRTGEIQAPKLRVSSLRYNTWLIHESHGEIQTLFIAP